MATTKPKKLTTGQRLDAIEARLAAVEGAVTSAPAQSAPQPTPAPSYGPGTIPGRIGPGVVTIRGATFSVREPIAADWEPGMEATTLASQGRTGDEPSNGWRVGKPMRSAAGYPIVYPVGRDANGNDIAAGQGGIVFAGRVHESDGAVADFRRQRGESVEANNAADAALASKSWPGDVGVWDLDLEDKKYLARMRGDYQAKTGKDLLFDGIVAGRTDHLNAAVHEGFHAPDFPLFDANAYNGKLAAAVRERMK